ncbi:MAG TPA: ABC transporter substrate-binding protein [Stellaceae bacterium]|nr:ABC transporter substrate-binding protein [Stellaceae bacterium]
MRGRTILLTLALALLFAASADAEPTKIRIGWIVPASDSPFLMFKAQGIARHEGTSYTLDFQHFQSTPLMVTALAAGELDMAELSYPAIANAVVSGAVPDVRVIADTIQDGVPGWYATEYFVLKDGPIKTVEDLKGKVYATNAIGAAPDIGFRSMLRKHHMDAKDVTIIEAPFPVMKAMLADHKIDIAMTPQPFSKDPGLRAMTRTLFTMGDAVGRMQLITTDTRASFIAQHRAAVVDYLEDELRALAWFSDPKNHDAAVKTIADFTKTPVALWNDWLFTHGDDFRDPNGHPDLKALQNNIDAEYDGGFLKSKIDVAQYADLSLVDEAAKRLK